MKGMYKSQSHLRREVLQFRVPQPTNEAHKLMKRKNSKQTTDGQGKNVYLKVHRILRQFSLSKTIVLTSLSSSSRVNSFFLTCLSWLRKLNSAAFFCSLANLFSYLETFFSVGFMLMTSMEYYQQVKRGISIYRTIRIAL